MTVGATVEIVGRIALDRLDGLHRTHHHRSGAAGAGEAVDESFGQITEPDDDA